MEIREQDSSQKPLIIDNPQGPQSAMALEQKVIRPKATRPQAYSQGMDGPQATNASENGSSSPSSQRSSSRGGRRSNGRRAGAAGN